MNGTARIERARSAIGKGIVYGGSTSGTHPTDPLPTRDGKADCSGFACWVFGIQKNKNATQVWLSTDHMVADATGKRLVFRPIPHAVPGCLAVYPGISAGPDKRVKEGHCCIVVDPDKRTIIDCSDGHNGITEHVGAYFWTKPTLWCVPVADPDSGPGIPWRVVVPALLLVATGVYVWARTRAA
jgi:hypothetical protein